MSANVITAGPSFINVGPGRCASSWMLEALESHPDISMARIKETEYFNTNFDRGDAWYESLFPNERTAAVGEISNCYYFEPTAAARIHAYDPQLKIIFNVRDPFTLLNSYHGFGVRRGLELTDVAVDLDTPVGRVMGSGYDHRQKKRTLNKGDDVSLLESVLLAQHFQRFIDLFPPEQIHVFVFERLKTDGDAALKEMYEFLGVDAAHVPPVASEVVNEAITPKSKQVARAAASFAFFLRQIGAYGLLDNLKKSRLVKRMFYRANAASGDKKVNLRETLDTATCDRLRQDMRRMIELHPPLAKYWQPLIELPCGVR